VSFVKYHNFYKNVIYYSFVRAKDPCNHHLFFQLVCILGGLKV